MGPPVYFSIEGSIRPDVPVRLFPTRQEWVITPGKGENVYKWVSSSCLCLLQKLTNRIVVSVSPASQMIGVNWAIDKARDNEEVRVALPVWLFDINIRIDPVAALPHRRGDPSVALCPSRGRLDNLTSPHRTMEFTLAEQERIKS